MKKFKAGDWVVNDNNTKHLFQVKESDNLEAINKISTYIPWQPKQGEWCWFWDWGYDNPILEQFQNMMEYEEECCHLFATIQGGAYRECEPFIGELPSFIKDTK